LVGVGVGLQVKNKHENITNKQSENTQNLRR
jgi:hypothetical protein